MDLHNHAIILLSLLGTCLLASLYRMLNFYKPSKIMPLSISFVLTAFISFVYNTFSPFGVSGKEKSSIPCKKAYCSYLPLSQHLSCRAGATTRITKLTVKLYIERSHLSNRFPLDIRFSWFMRAGNDAGKIRSVKSAKIRISKRFSESV